MARLLRVALFPFLVGLAAYTGSFYATRSALAHYSHCDAAGPPWTAVPCNDVAGGIPRYYAGQRGNTAYPGGFSNGIVGFISAQDVSIHDTSQDFIADWIGVRNVTSADEWVQLGFTEGCCFPNGEYRTTPRVYTENKGNCYGTSFVERSTPAPNPRYNEYFRVSWAGASGFGCGQTVYIWQFGRGSGFATFDYGFMYVSSGRFRATTEFRDRTHMEPNGTQCFGGGYLCTSDYGYDLWLWSQSGGYWDVWNYSHPTIEDENEVVQGYASVYFHDTVSPWERFKTTSNWQ